MKRISSRFIALILALSMLLGTMAFASAEQTELRKVTVVCNDSFNTVYKMEHRFENSSYQVFTEEMAKRGVEIVYETMPKASLSDNIRMRMAAQNDIPDIIPDAWSGITESEIIAWARNGLLHDVLSLADKYDEDGSIVAYYEKYVPGIIAATTLDDGGMYWFHYLNSPTYLLADGSSFDYPGNPYMPAIRADWLEKAGVPYSRFMTPDELITALKAIQDADANGNGEKDEVVSIGINGFDNGLAMGFGLSTRTLVAIDFATNKVFNNFTNPVFKDYIAFMKRIYDEGLFDTTLLDSGMATQFMSDNKISLANHYTLWTQYEQQIIGAENPCYAPFILDDDAGENGFSATIDPIYGTYNHYMITSACKDPEAAMAIFDYVYTDEYAWLDILGVEGKGYEINAAGLPVSLADPNLPEDQIWPDASLRFSVGMFSLPCVLTTPNVYDRATDEEIIAVGDYRKPKYEMYLWWLDGGAQKANKENKQVLDLFLAIPTEDELTRTNDITDSLSTYVEELLTDLVLGNRSIDDLDKYLAEMDSLGYAEYLDIIQTRRDRYVAIVGDNK